jgi:hypothetical protein
MCPWYAVGGKICVKNLGKSAIETLAILTLAYDEHAMKKSGVFKWHRRFKEGQEDVQDDPRSGQPKLKVQAQMWTEYKPWCAHIRD